MTAWGEAEHAAALERIAARAAELPGTVVEDARGHTGVLVRGKRFAWLVADHHGDGRLALWVKAPPGEQEALVAAEPERYYVPAYVGHSGWVAAHLDRGHDPDWTQIHELVEQGWRLTAGKRAVAALDAQRGA